MTFTFADDDEATVAYPVSGVSHNNPTTPEQVGSRCRYARRGRCRTGARDELRGSWWAAPAGAESGWGINFAHQGDTIVARWFTFGLDGKPLWLIVERLRDGAERLRRQALHRHRSGVQCRSDGSSRTR